jgi:hypothetical protein
MTDLAIKSCLTIDDELAHVLWEIFRPGMERIEKKTPYKQGLKCEEFYPMMADASFRKYVLYENDTVVGLAIIATDVSKVDWLSIEYFKSTYGDAPVYYVVGVAMAENCSLAAKMGGRMLIVSALDDLPEDGTFVYDFSCSIHASLSSFGEMITKDAGRVRMIDAIEYWEIKHSRAQNRNQSGSEHRLSE